MTIAKISVKRANRTKMAILFDFLLKSYKLSIFKKIPKTFDEY